MKYLSIVFSFFVLIIGHLGAQHIHYSTLSGYCEDAETEQFCEGEADEQCPCPRHRWEQDRFAEEQYQELGWPNRRDELSDQLAR